MLSAENRTSCLGISIINKRALNLYQTAVESQICNLDLLKKKVYSRQSSNMVVSTMEREMHGKSVQLVLLWSAINPLSIIPCCLGPPQPRDSSDRLRITWKKLSVSIIAI